jgi:hypothetical protein
VSDFNARVGVFTGDPCFNHCDDILQDWIYSQDITLWINVWLMEDLPQLYTMVVAPSPTDLDSLQLTIRDDLSMDSNRKVVALFFSNDFAICI